MRHFDMSGIDDQPVRYPEVSASISYFVKGGRVAAIKRDFGSW